MGWRKQLLYIGSALRSALVELVIGIILLVAICIFLRMAPLGCGDNQVVSFLVGVAASIIATLFLKVSDKYTEDRLAASKILKQVTSFVSYVDEKSTDGFDYQRGKTELQRRYIDICELSTHLSYKKDFNALSIALGKIVRIAYADGTQEEFEDAVQQLISVRDSIFEC